MSRGAAAGSMTKTGSKISGLFHAYKRGKWGVSLEEPLPLPKSSVLAEGGMAQEEIASEL